MDTDRLGAREPLIGKRVVGQESDPLLDDRLEHRFRDRYRALRAHQDLVVEAGQLADLIKTLEAFFTCHGNLSQTAEMLIVHRNTLLYRMNRINEIADIDLNRPETRLALHLALTIQRLV